MTKELTRHTFTFNPSDNGGEQLSLETLFYSNGDKGQDGIFLNQKLSLQSYCNNVVVGLYGCTLTPKILRQLANELEVVYNKAVAKNNPAD